MADTTRRDFHHDERRGRGGRGGRACARPIGAAGGDSAGAFYEKGAVRIRYLDTGGAGFPLLIIPGGGLNSTITGLIRSHPFNAIDEFKSEFRCITCDLRTAYAGESTRAARSRPAVGRVHRRSHRHHGSPWDRQIHGARLLHRRPVHLELARAGAQPRRRGGDGAAERLPPRAARPLLQQQHDGLGRRDREAPARDHGADGRSVPDAHVQDQPRLRVHGYARLRASDARRRCSCCPTTSRRIRTPSRWRP